MAAIYSQIFEDVLTPFRCDMRAVFAHYTFRSVHNVTPSLSRFLSFSDHLIHSRSLPVISNSISLHFIIFHYITLTSLITRSATFLLLPSQATSRDTLIFILRITCDSDIDVRVHTALKLPLKSIRINLIIRIYITRMNISWFFD